MNCNNHLEKEYMMLREEIMYNQKHRDQLAQFGYTVTFAVITASLTINNAWLMICILPFLLPITLRCAECSHSIAYIAAYIKTHLEPQIGFQWETNNLEYCNRYKRKGLGALTYYAARLDFPILTLISSILFWMLREFDFYVGGSLWCGIIIVLVQTLFITVETIILLKFINLKKLKNKLHHNWKEL